MALWSSPLRFVAPPADPSIISVKWLSETELQVEWTPSSAAVTYRLTLHSADGSELLEKDDLEDSSWVGIADPGTKTIRVYAFGVDETSCLEPGKASVPQNPFLPHPPSRARPSSPKDASPRLDARDFSPAPSSAGGDADNPEITRSQPVKSAKSTHKSHTSRPKSKRATLDEPDVVSSSKSRADSDYDDFEDATTDEEEEDNDDDDDYIDDDNETASIWQFNKDDEVSYSVLL